MACAQDIFQRMMDQILDRCKGVIGITDDFITHGMKVHEGCKRTWTGTEQEVWSQEQLCQILCLCLWQAWSSLKSIKSQCHQGDACPTEQRRASELPWNGNIPLTIHLTTIFSPSNTQKTPEDQCRIQLECYISSHIWQAQIIGMWGHNTEVLQHEETSKSPSHLIQQGTRSRTHPGW